MRSGAGFHVEACHHAIAAHGERQGGGTDVSSMLWEILARPSQLAALMRIAADAYAARAALVRLRRVLGRDFRCG